MPKLHAVKPVKMSLQSLSEMWLLQKEAEDTARETRLAIEEHIAELVPGGLEGTANATTERYRVKVVRKLTRSLDPEAYEDVRSQIPPALDPVTFKPALDLKRLRAIEQANPELFKLCAKFVTAKPAKPSVTVEEVRK